MFFLFSFGDSSVSAGTVGLISSVQAFLPPYRRRHCSGGPSSWRPCARVRRDQKAARLDVGGLGGREGLDGLLDLLLDFSLGARRRRHALGDGSGCHGHGGHGAGGVERGGAHGGAFVRRL